MTSLETLNTKVSFNKLRFPIVTHTVYSDARFDRYRILKSGQVTENFLERLDTLANDQVLGVEDARIL
jgi:adenosine deaminase